MNSLVITRALFAISGLVFLSMSAFAQETQLGLPLHSLGSDGLTESAGLGFNQALRGYRSLALAGNDLFTFAGSLAWIEPTTQDLQPAPSSTERRRVQAAPTTEPEVSDVLLSARSSPVYTGGEVGFSYGRATGKYGGTSESGYVIGEVGNDKFHLSAGASYEHFSGRVPRWGR